MKIDRNHFLVITTLFLVVNLSLYAHYGIKVGNDSPRYMEWANQLGFFNFKLSEWRFWYFSYVFFISPVVKTGLPLEIIIICQVVVSYVSTLCLYALTYSLCAEKKTSLLATFIFLLWIEIASWNIYILTESLFTSSIIILLYVLVKTKTNKNAGYLLIPLLTLVVLIRPMGITVLVAALIFLYYQYNWHRKPRILFRSSLVIGSIALPLIFLYFLTEGSPNVHFYYSNGQIVWGTDQMPLWKDNTWLAIDNSSVVYPDRNLPAIQKFFLFTIENFSFQCEMFFKKVIMFFVHVKPYYSVPHNVFILFTLPFIYLFGFYALTFVSLDISVRKFVFGLFLFNMIMTGLTVEAWDGRFLIPTLPPLIIFTSIGVATALREWRLFEGLRKFKS